MEDIDQGGQVWIGITRTNHLKRPLERRAVLRARQLMEPTDQKLFLSVMETSRMPILNQPTLCWIRMGDLFPRSRRLDPAGIA